MFPNDTRQGGHIRSFATRQGHLSEGQRKAIERLLPVHGVPYKAEVTDVRTLYPQPQSPMVLEIGCGMGETTAHIATVLPNTNFLGCEVYPAGVGALLNRIDQQGLRNLKVIQHDAVEVVRDMIAPDSLDGVHVFFPDPWHKKKHHKRRLIQPEFTALLASRLKPGGYLHCATDWEEYAQQMLEVLSACSLLHNTAADYAQKPAYRPLTKFEDRGIKLGHGVWDLVFQRRSTL